MSINLYEIKLKDSIIENTNLLDSILFDCQCALFLVDMTNSDSFIKISRLITSIDDEKYYFLKKIIVQNKSDISHETNNEEVQKFIEEKPNVDCVTISVKTGDNLDILLDKIYHEVNSDDSRKKAIPINNVAKYILNDNPKIDCQSSFSLVMVGESGVGKTNLLSRYDKNVFLKIFLSTIGTNKQTKILKIYDKNCYKLFLNDTAGQERFRVLPSSYYRNCDCILLLFDVNDRNSFNKVSTWMGEINENSDKSEDNKVVVYLIGNKIDLLEDEHEIITKEEKEKLAKDLGVQYFETSCKWNLNIEEVMARIVLDCYKKNRTVKKSFQITKATKTPKGKRNCC